MYLVLLVLLWRGNARQQRADSRPHSLGSRIKGSEDKGFPVQDSGTSGLHVCSRDVSIYCVKEPWRFKISVQDFFVFISQLKKFELIQTPLSPVLFVSHAMARSAKRSERGYEYKNATGLAYRTAGTVQKENKRKKVNHSR